MNKKVSLLIILLLSIVGVFAVDSITNTTSINNSIIYSKSNFEMNESVTEKIEINPYKDNKINGFKINNEDVKFENVIGSHVKEILNNVDGMQTKYMLVQFNRNPTQEEITSLKKEGVKIVEYKGGNSY